MSEYITNRAMAGTGIACEDHYVSPRLRSLGDVREFTLGGSSGSGDSGAPTQQNIPGPPI